MTFSKYTIGLVDGVESVEDSHETEAPLWVLQLLESVTSVKPAGFWPLPLSRHQKEREWETSGNKEQQLAVFNLLFFHHHPHLYSSNSVNGIFRYNSLLVYMISAPTSRSRTSQWLQRQHPQRVMPSFWCSVLTLQVSATCWTLNYVMRLSRLNVPSPWLTTGHLANVINKNTFHEVTHSNVLGWGGPGICQ